MSDHRKKRRFLELPRYTAGKQAFAQFLKENLKYPEEAVKAGIEGTVIVEIDIDDNGIVHNPRIFKGIGYGCDEEAMRLAKLLRYGKVKNKGVRVRTKSKVNIRFKLPKKKTIQYTVTPAKKEVAEKKSETATKPEVTYTYTINLP